MLKILKLIIIITFLLTIQIIKNAEKIDDLSTDYHKVVSRALTDDLFLIFHEQNTVTIRYSQSKPTILTDTPFKYLGTSYPLVYKYPNNNELYYIVSITEKIVV